MDQVTLDRFFGFEHELEIALRENYVVDDGVRDAVSIVRGYLELARDHAVPVEIDALESALARVATMIGESKWRRSFLQRLRAAAGWARMTPAAA